MDCIIELGSNPWASPSGKAQGGARKNALWPPRFLALPGSNSGRKSARARENFSSRHLRAGDIRRRARDQRWPAGVMPAVFAALNRELKARLGDIYEGRVDTVGMLGARMRERGYDPGEWVARDRRVAGMLLGYWSFERTESPFFIFRLFARIEPSSGLAWEYICSRRRRDAGR